MGRLACGRDRLGRRVAAALLPRAASGLHTLASTTGAVVVSTWLTVSGAEQDKAQGWFDRHGKKAVFLCQLILGLRSLISIPAGIHAMAVLLFLAYTAPGVAI